MTKEEAMEIITNALQSDESKYTEKIDKALALAQKAFGQEPCEDAISRKALIERINQAEENFRADHIESISSGDDPFVDGVLSGVFNIRQMVAQAPPILQLQPYKAESEG